MTDVPEFAPPTPRKRNRARPLDLPVVQYVAHFGVVTTYQLLYHFFTSRGRSPVYGWRLISHLRDSDLITAHPIYPARGKASLNYIQLTATGWRMAGLEPPREFRKPLTAPVLMFKLQWAEMMLQRAQEGWREVKAETTGAVLKRWALAPYRNRMVNDHEILERAQLERMPEAAAGVPVLIHPGNGDVRLVLAADPAKSLRKIMSRLPAFHLFPEIQFELVNPDTQAYPELLHIITRHSERNGYRFALHEVPHFSSRPNPRGRG